MPTTRNLNSIWIVINEAIFSLSRIFLCFLPLHPNAFPQEIYITFKRCTLIHLFWLFCRVAEGFPDPRTCLLHQKLQMLNICINRRRIREGNLSHAMANSNQRNKDSRSDESDDEFFDCDVPNDDESGDFLPWNRPEGRLSKLNDMKLIDSDEYLYVPITQEPVPKSEDQLEDDAEILLKLGPESGKSLPRSVNHINLFSKQFTARCAV